MREAKEKAAAMLQKLASGSIPNGKGTSFAYKDPPPPKEEADAQFEEFAKRVYLRLARRKGVIC